MLVKKKILDFYFQCLIKAMQLDAKISWLTMDLQLYKEIILWIKGVDNEFNN